MKLEHIYAIIRNCKDQREFKKIMINEGITINVHYSLYEILKRITEKYDLPIEELFTGRKFENITKVKHIFLYVAHVYQKIPQPKIAAFLNMEMANVSINYRRVADRMKLYPGYKKEVEEFDYMKINDQ